MNWKEFLKPTKEKVLLTVIICLISFAVFAISFLIVIIGEFGAMTPSGAPEFYNSVKGFIDVVGNILGLAYFLPALIGRFLNSIFFDKVSPKLGALNNIILFTIYVYAMSCLVSWVHKKVRKK